MLKCLIKFLVLYLYAWQLVHHNCLWVLIPYIIVAWSLPPSILPIVTNGKFVYLFIKKEIILLWSTSSRFLETSVTFLEDFINSNYSFKELVELYSGRLIPNNQQNEDIISKKVNPTNYVVVLYLFSIIIFNIIPTIILTKVLLTTNHYILKGG